MTMQWPTFSKGEDDIQQLIKLSQFYGSDPSFCLAGGGNTSVKVGDLLYVKASGVGLGTITKDGFVILRRPQLSTIADSDFGTEVETRESKYKDAILASRTEPEKGQRPSVESLLHHLMPGKFVVHTHATVVNALTCRAGGEKMAKELFGDNVLWIPFVDPGYTLGKVLKNAIDGNGGKRFKAVLMANHGLIVSGDSAEEIKKNTDDIVGAVASRLGASWNVGAFGEAKRAENAGAMLNVIGPALRGLLAEGPALKVVTFEDSDIIMGFVGTAKAREAAQTGPLNPDQIVYCYSFPLWFEPPSMAQPTPVEVGEIVENLRTALAAHKKQYGYLPRVVLVKGVGLFAAGEDFAAADTARGLYKDAIQIMAGATRLGGISYLSAEKREFIENWEVEAYRRQIAKMSGKGGRATGKIAVVTGAAQGFGLEIAQGFAAEGGHVALTDVNDAGAQKAADELCAAKGKGKAMGAAINVTSDESVSKCIEAVIRKYGGFDVFISNAGVLKAESVKTQSEKDFDFVTAVNYKGYFLCVQKASSVFAIQHKAKPDYMSDIIQINSKSGLQGSNKNASYAGSKFGGIGLTQSFAMELIEDGVKVNSICPGNFFDGPLWSDPQNGLFVQYLRTGKVPGAKTIEDVKKFYEAKVPMNRGCRTIDVMRAVFYLMEQEYETGQALPVTGGQVMLK